MIYGLNRYEIGFRGFYLNWTDARPRSSENLNCSQAVGRIVLVR